jgi:hypothetical protein
MAAQRPIRSVSLAGTASLLIGLTAATAAVESSACQVIPLTYPAAGSQVKNVHPELAWEQRGNGPYRVQLTVNLPEAKVLFAMDTTTTANRLQLSATFPASFAAVKVLVSQDCPLFDAQDLNALGPAFFIDARALCAVASAAYSAAKDTLVWSPVAGAQRYVLRIFETTAAVDEGSQTRLLLLSDTVLPNFSIPSSLLAKKPHFSASVGVTRVASIQAICGDRPGPTVQLQVSPAPTPRTAR